MMTANRFLGALRGVGPPSPCRFWTPWCPPLRRANRQAAGPHGVRLRAQRHRVDGWNPAYEGNGSAAHPQARGAIQDDILVLGNLTHNTGRALLDGAGVRALLQRLSDRIGSRRARWISKPALMDQIAMQPGGRADAVSLDGNRPGGFAPIGRLRFRLFRAYTNNLA
jgi:hypothetical protein